MGQELKECPFCGKMPFWFEYHANERHIGCNNPKCILHGYSFNFYKWNTRHTPVSVKGNELKPLDEDLIKYYQQPESKEWMDASMGQQQERDELEEAKNDMEHIMANEFPARALLQYGYSKFGCSPVKNVPTVEEIMNIICEHFTKRVSRQSLCDDDTFLTRREVLAQAIHNLLTDKGELNK